MAEEDLILDGQRETPEEFKGNGDDDPELARWKAEISRGLKYYEDYFKRVDKIIALYRAEDKRRRNDSDGARRYNALWSMCSTLQPALFQTMPRAYVSRRYNDQDKIARNASMILERCLTYMNDSDDALDSFSTAVDDYILGGRGVVWPRYNPMFDLTMSEQRTYYEDGEKTPEGAELGQDDQGQYYRAQVEHLSDETIDTDHIQMTSFLTPAASKIKTVPWMAKRVFMTRQELVKRFGKKLGKDVPLKYRSDGSRFNAESRDPDRSSAPNEQQALFLTAPVWEIWCRTDRKVRWLCMEFDQMLDVQDDPLGLSKFFPAPKPLYGTMTANSLIPVPDFKFYEDISRELDELTYRISLLTESLRVVGVYDASLGEIVQRLTKNTRENDMLPIKNWGEFAEKGGMRKAIDFLPLDQIIMVLKELYDARRQLVQELYELTGISDIARGASDPRETAAAQKLKGQYVSQRLKRQVQKVMRFHLAHMEIQAEIICKHFDDSTIMRISDAQQYITDMQGNFDQQAAAAALQVLRSDPMRCFRIKIDNRTLADDDMSADREDGLKFIEGVSKLLSEAVPLSQSVPKLAPVLKEMILFGSRMFPVARSVELRLEQCLDALTENMPPPEPKNGPKPMDPQEFQVKMRELDIREQELGVQRQANMIAEAGATRSAGIEHRKLDVAMQTAVNSDKRQLTINEATQANKQADRQATTQLGVARLAVDSHHRGEDRQANMDQQNAERFHEHHQDGLAAQRNVTQAIVEKVHDAKQAGLDRTHEATQANLDRAHEAIQAVADRKQKAEDARRQATAKAKAPAAQPKP